MRKLALHTVRGAKILVRRKTGNLGRSIHIASVTDTSAVVVASANYAGFIEYGTRPHVITPTHGKVLAWPSSSSGRRLSGSPRKAMYGPKAASLGGWSYAAVVHHPGTRPYPFMLPAARQAVREAGLTDVVVAAWNGAA